jgi:hypothetical protein
VDRGAGRQIAEDPIDKSHHLAKVRVDYVLGAKWLLREQWLGSDFCAELYRRPSLANPQRLQVQVVVRRTACARGSSISGSWVP